MTKETTEAPNRRRGEQLERAVYEATVAELAMTGYGGLTMERIGARAGTGKGPLYRRWAGKRDLVLAALSHTLPPLPTPRRDNSARQNLLALFSSLADMMAGKTDYPSLFVMVQLLHEPELRTIYTDSVVAPRMRIIDAILRDGVALGQIDPVSVTPFSARLGPALIVQQVLLTGAPPTRAELAAIVDELIMVAPTPHLTAN